MSKFLTRLANRAGAAPGMVGALLLVQLALVRALASANAERVFVLGRELHWDCWFRQEFGFPCPTCGMTRSVLLSLRGELGEAMHLNPAGPLLVLGLILFSLAMLFLMLLQQRATRLASGATHRRIRIGASVYGSFLLVVLFAHWLDRIPWR
jgi:hypothetical protein